MPKIQRIASARASALRRPAPRTIAVLAGTAVIVALVPALGGAAEPGLSRPTTTPGPLMVLRGVTSTDPRLEPPTTVNDAIAVTSTSNTGGENSALALRADGSVVGWGANTFGQATPPATLKDAVSVDLGGGFGVALRTDGSVAAWGSNAAGALDVPTDLGPVTAVSAGGTTTPTSACGYVLALRPDQTVARWGGAQADGTCKAYGSAYDPPEGLTGVIAISAGSTAALALKSDGTVVGWGPAADPNSTGIALSRWHDITAISTDDNRFIGLQSDHSVDLWGFVSEAPVRTIPSDIVAISAGETSTFLSSDGSLHERGRQERDTDPMSYFAAAAGYDYTVEVADVIGDPGTTDPTTDPTSDPTPSGPALGTDVVQTRVDDDLPGMAEAFQYTATYDAEVSTLHIYLDASNTASSLIVGVYGDVNNSPGNLLSSGRLQSTSAGAWNVAVIDPTAVAAGQKYWLALVAPVGTGMVKFRALPEGKGGGPAATGPGGITATTGLPVLWATNARWHNSPASMFVD